MKRPTPTSGLDELTACVQAAGYASVAPWVAAMWDVLEEISASNSSAYPPAVGSLPCRARSLTGWP
jgi:hypothetical protein